MNWNAKDVETYFQEKEYIDTAVIPVLPIMFGTKMRHAAEQGEYIQLLSQQLERQFKGRMLFLPPFTYLEEPEAASDLLNEWVSKLKENGFTYIFLITADKRWIPIQTNDHNTFIHVPAVPIQHMDDVQKHSLVEEQLKQIMAEIIEGWQASI
ncbi:YpiF family protein [Bacillus sp. FSL K6-3431]|uniref:YpiF family protein n=1 Tax=Bacillus sp. FSL K6-3431 TaxID=2921500 RepID=UPI0030F9ADAB